MEKAVSFSFLSAMFLGWSIVIGTVVAKVLPPVAFIAVAYVASFFFIVVLSSFSKKPFQGKEIIRLFKRDFLILFLFRGILGSIFFIYGFSLTTGVRASFIPLIEPAFVLFFSWMVGKEAVRRKKISLLALLVLGSYLFITNGASIFDQLFWGDLLIMIGVLCYSASYLPAAKISEKVNPQSIMAMVNGLSGLFFLFVGFPFLGALASLTKFDAFLLLAFIITGPVVGIFLWYKAMKVIAPWVVSSLLTIQVLAGALLAFFWLGQILLPLQLAGGMLMLLSAFLISKEAGR